MSVLYIVEGLSEIPQRDLSVWTKSPDVCSPTTGSLCEELAYVRLKRNSIMDQGGSTWENLRSTTPLSKQHHTSPNRKGSGKRDIEAGVVLFRHWCGAP